MGPVAYRYDGTFAGFLSCVFESYAAGEEPCRIAPEGEDALSLYPEREIVTDEARAGRVYRALKIKISAEARKLVSDGFLTCLPEREVHLLRFIRMGLSLGPSVMRHLTDERVRVLGTAVLHARREAQLYLGFVRFSQFGPVLAGEIAPKNRVLPMIAPHFRDRFGDERFALYDRTHREALFHEPGRWGIIPVESFALGDPGTAERAYRQMWKRFYDTISIEGRKNPRCRMTHMPKRYWDLLPELDPANDTPDRLTAGR